MQSEYIVPWNDDFEEVVFTSHTSIISKELLYEKLVEMDIVEAGIDIHFNDKKQVVPNTTTCKQKYQQLIK